MQDDHEQRRQQEPAGVGKQPGREAGPDRDPDETPAGDLVSRLLAGIAPSDHQLDPEGEQHDLGGDDQRPTADEVAGQPAQQRGGNARPDRPGQQPPVDQVEVTVAARGDEGGGDGGRQRRGHGGKRGDAGGVQQRGGDG